MLIEGNKGPSDEGVASAQTMGSEKKDGERKRREMEIDLAAT